MAHRLSKKSLIDNADNVFFPIFSDKRSDEPEPWCCWQIVVEGASVRQAVGAGPPHQRHAGRRVQDTTGNVAQASRRHHTVLHVVR